MDTSMGVPEPSEWTQVWVTLAFRMDRDMGIPEPSECTQVWVS